MGEIITLKTPTGGDASIAVERSGRSVTLIVKRELAGGDAVSELICAFSPAQARKIAAAMAEAAGGPP